MLATIAKVGGRVKYRPGSAQQLFVRAAAHAGGARGRAGPGYCGGDVLGAALGDVLGDVLGRRTRRNGAQARS